MKGFLAARQGDFDVYARESETCITNFQLLVQWACSGSCSSPFCPFALEFPKILSKTKVSNMWDSLYSRKQIIYFFLNFGLMKLGKDCKNPLNIKLYSFLALTNWTKYWNQFVLKASGFPKSSEIPSIQLSSSDKLSYKDGFNIWVDCFYEGTFLKV